MKQRFVFASALALAFAVPLAFAQPPAKAAKSPDAVPPGPPPRPVERAEWFRSGPDGSLDEAKQAWKAYKQAYEGDPERIDFARRSFVVKEGLHAGHWQMRYDEGDDLVGALQLRFPAAPPYWVQVRVFCGRDQVACASLRSEAAQMDAPQPDDDKLFGDWARVLMNERCEGRMAQQLFPPIYPREEQRRGITGVVTLQILFNACGRVREAWVVRSSGNRNLDRAAMVAGRKWSVETKDNRGGMARSDIEFKLDGDTALPAPSASASP